MILLCAQYWDTTAKGLEIDSVQTSSYLIFGGAVMSSLLLSVYSLSEDEEE